MAAATYNIVIDQGSDFAMECVPKNDGVPVDLTGYMARAHLRAKQGADVLVKAFDCTVVDAANGLVKMEMTNADTQLLTPGNGYYDLEIYTANDVLVSRLLQGKVKITPETTK
jgi:hypothetical protein